MKKGLLRILSALVAVSMLLCMGVVAFAADYNVVTRYDSANDEVTVTTSVTGATPYEQVAFLVEKAENIVWIDQKPADASGNANSAFTDAADDAVGATVKVGTSSLAASTFGEAKTIALPNYTVTWSVTGTSKVYAVTEETSDNDGTTSTSDKVTFYIMAAANEELTGITETIGGGEAADLAINEVVVGSKVTRTVNANATYAFTFATKDVSAAPAPQVAAGAVTAPTESTKTASVVATATNATEFGILVAVAPETGDFDFSVVTADNIDEYSTSSAVIRKYHALGANAAGQFAIELQDTNSVFFVDDIKYDACVYALGSALELGAVFDLN